VPEPLPVPEWAFLAFFFAGVLRVFVVAFLGEVLPSPLSLGFDDVLRFLFLVVPPSARLALFVLAFSAFALIVGEWDPAFAPLVLEVQTDFPQQKHFGATRVRTGRGDLGVATCATFFLGFLTGTVAVAGVDDVAAGGAAAEATTDAEVASMTCPPAVFALPSASFESAFTFATADASIAADTAVLGRCMRASRGAFDASGTGPVWTCNK
jgi:hypothetical protein